MNLHDLGSGAASNAWVVASGKGGVGTSTVAALLSVRASRSGLSVLLIDGDVQFGVQHLLFGVPGGHGLATLGRGGSNPMDLPIPVAEGLMVLCGGPAGDQVPPVGAELKAVFRRVSPLLRAFGTSLVDAGSRHATVHAALGAGANKLVAVSQPDRISIAATYALIKRVWEGDRDVPVQVMINSATSEEAQTAFQAISTACDRFLGGSVRFAGAIPEDPTLRARLADGVAIHDDELSGPAFEAAGFAQRRIHERDVPVIAYQGTGRM